MNVMIDRVFSRPWFWCIMFPLVVATVAGVYGRTDLMEGMFGAACFFGFGFGMAWLLRFT